MRKELFLNENFYHIYNRGIEKRNIFIDERDYERFAIGLCLFNDARLHDYDFSKINIRSLASYELHKRMPLVDILHWCQMPNHFHLFVHQRLEGGTSTFMHKLGTGFTKYFNEKYGRSGGLFEGPFKAKHVGRDDYFSHLGAYIAMNPLDLYKPGWKTNGLSRGEIVKYKNKLIQYKWSSFRDYFGSSFIPHITVKEKFFEIFGEKNFEALINQSLSRGLSSEHEAKLRVYEA